MTSLGDTLCLEKPLVQPKEIMENLISRFNQFERDGKKARSDGHYRSVSHVIGGTGGGVIPRQAFGNPHCYLLSTHPSGAYMGIRPCDTLVAGN